MANYGYLSSSPAHYADHNQIKRSAYESNCCGLSTSFIAFILSVFNFILFFSGLIILTIVILYEHPPFEGEQDLHLPVIRSLLSKSHPLNLIHYKLILCGFLVCLIAIVNIFLNCYYSIKRREQDVESIGINNDLDEIALTSHHDTTTRTPVTSRKTDTFPSFALCSFIFALLLLFTIQLCISVFALFSVYGTGNGEEGYTQEFKRSITENLGDASKVVRDHPDVFRILEKEFKCCGLGSYEDYDKDNPVPDSCCKTAVSDYQCGKRRHPSNIYFQGCIFKISKVASDHTLLLGSVAFGFSLIQIFGLVFSCCLYVQLVANKTS